MCKCDKLQCRNRAHRSVYERVHLPAQEQSLYCGKVQKKELNAPWCTKLERFKRVRDPKVSL